MNNELLNFQAPVDLIFGNGSLAQIASKLEEKDLTNKRALIVTDKGLVQSGLVDKLTDRLEEVDTPFSVFSGVESSPPVSTVEEGFQQYRQESCDLVIGIGGGSSMDTAKVIAVLATNEGDISDFAGVNNVPKPPAPLIAIPTTSGTGAEVTFNAVITNPEEKRKMVIISPRIAPDLAICDPLLTISLPPMLTASTGMDALTHSIESFTNDVFNPLADMITKESIQLIGKYLPKAVAKGEDREARYWMLYASTITGLAFNLTRLANVHAISLPVSAHFGVPHGIANAILLPYVMEWNLSGCLDKSIEVAKLLGENVEGANKWEAALKSVKAVRRLSQEIGIPRSLSEVDVTEDKIPVMAEDAIKSGNVLVNPRQTTKDDIIEVLHNAL